MSRQASDQSLFWDLLQHQPPLQQSLAKVSLGSLVKRLDSARLGTLASAVRGAFDRWLIGAVRAGKRDVTARVDELISNNGALEQRVAKLKTLLARMHQASQRHTEESAVIKKVQKEAAKEIESVKSKEEREKRLLELQLRNFEIENAFKEDVEISIQRAALAVTQSYSAKPTSNSSDAKLVSKPGTEPPSVDAGLLPGSSGGAGQQNGLLAGEAEQKAALLMDQIAALSADLEAVKEQLNSAKLQNTAHKKSTDALVAELERERVRSSTLKAELADERSSRRDIEAELNIIISRESTMSREFDAEKSIKTNKRVVELTESLGECESRVADLTKGLASANQQADKAKKEAAAFRSSMHGMKNLERENRQLTLMLKELRKNTSDRNPSSGKLSTATQDTKKEFELPPGTVIADEAMLRDVFSIANYSVNVWRSYQSIGFFPTGILVSSGGGGAGEISNIVKMQTGQSGVDEGLVESAVAVAIRFCDLLVSCDTAATSDPSTGNAGTPYQSLSGALEAVLKLKDTVSESIDMSPTPSVDCIPEKDPTIARDAEPMVWEAHSVTLSPGKEAIIPVLLSASPAAKNADMTVSLEWKLWGDDDLSYLGVTLARMTESSIGDPVASQPFLANDRSSFSGRTISPGLNGVLGSLLLDTVGGDVKLRVVNNAMWSSMTFSYSVRLTVACKDPTVELAQEEELKHVAVPATRRPIDTEKVDRYVTDIRLTVEALQRAKNEVRTALDACKTACLQTTEQRSRLVEAMHSHDSFVRENIWYLASPPYYDDAVMDSSEAAALLPVSIRPIKSKTSESVVAGPDLASTSLNYIYDAITQDTSNFRLGRQKLNSACTTPLSTTSGHISRASSFRSIADSTTATDKFSFSADGVVVPAGGDFRLPITVSRGSVVHISWNLKLVGGDDMDDVSGKGVVPKDAATLNSDIGFAILLKRTDGTLPMLLPYKRVCRSLKADLGSARFEIPLVDADSDCDESAMVEEHATLTVLFDNSYSWLTSKTLRYSVSVEEDKRSGKDEYQPPAPFVAEDTAGIIPDRSGTMFSEDGGDIKLSARDVNASSIEELLEHSRMCRKNAGERLAEIKKISTDLSVALESEALAKKRVSDAVYGLRNDLEKAFLSYFGCPVVSTDDFILPVIEDGVSATSEHYNK